MLSRALELNMLEIFRSGWFWEMMCQNRAGKFWQWYCIFFILLVTDGNRPEGNKPVFSYPPSPALNLLLDKCRHRRGRRNCFVSCLPKWLHVRVYFAHVVTVVLQLCRSILWLWASLAACFHACNLACLILHKKFRWKWSGHKGVGIFVAAVPEKEAQAGNRKRFPVADLLGCKKTPKLIQRVRNVQNFSAELQVKF